MVVDVQGDQADAFYLVEKGTVRIGMTDVVSCGLSVQYGVCGYHVLIVT